MAAPINSLTRWQHLLIHSLDGSTYTFIHHRAAPNTYVSVLAMFRASLGVEAMLHHISLLNRWQHIFIIPSDPSIPISHIRWQHLFVWLDCCIFFYQIVAPFYQMAALIFSTKLKHIFIRWQHLFFSTKLQHIFIRWQHLFFSTKLQHLFIWWQHLFFLPNCSTFLSDGSTYFFYQIAAPFYLMAALIFSTKLQHLFSKRW